MMLGLGDLRIIPASGEEIIEPGQRPDEAVRSLSLAKAREVLPFCEAQDIVIAADTLVFLDGEILEKPRNEAEAFSMLSRLSGRVHEVFTGVSIIRGNEVFTEYERTDVRFRELTAQEIRNYIATGEPMDKAGAYGAQGRGAVFVEGIEGDFFNVMGLPLCRLSKMLKKMGVDLI